MLTYVVRRLLFSVPVVIITSFLIFTFVSLSGNPLAELRTNPRISQSTIQNIMEKKHLDKPIPTRYVFWVQEAFVDKFGFDMAEQEIWPDLRRAIGVTLQLIIAAEALAVVFAIGVGVYSAVKQYSIFDYTATTLSFVGFSTPIFWMALILQVLFTNLYLQYGTRLVYTSGLNSANPENFWLDRLQHLALPIFVLAVIEIAQFSRYMRASMLDVINSDYVRTARAKGLRERRVIMKHAFRNGLIPLTTVVAINFGALFGGAIVTETVFSIPGMGQYFIQALFRRDAYQIMAWLMVTSVIVIAFNLIADLLYGLLDPRIRYD